MPDPAPRRPLTNPLEALETRDMPAATPWLVEPFQRGPVSGLPQGWATTGTDPAGSFRVNSTASGHGDTGRLESSGNARATTRAWLVAPFAADVEASAAMFLGTPAPARLFVRGQNLNTATPSYYAVEVARGAEIRLIEVDRGVETLHGRVKTPDYVSSKWVTATIKAEGDTIRVLLHRGDTNQYLAANGKWVRQPTAALEIKDQSIRVGGQVGFARGSGTGQVAVDSLRVAPASDAVRPVIEERFSRGQAAGVPPGWTAWAATGTAAVNTTTDETLRLGATANTASRAYLTRSLAPDSQVSSSLFIESLTPAGLFARGQRINTNSPTYYALEVTRGLEASLVRVVNGVRTSLLSVRSRDYVSNVWLQTSLVLNGDQIRAQIYRSDTGYYLRQDGTWGLSPTWVMTARDGAIPNGGVAGLSRGAGPTGQFVFDNFIVTTSPDRYSKPGAIPTEADKPTVVALPDADLPRPVPPTVPPPAPAPKPTVPPVSTINPSRPTVHRNYSHVRLAQLAYFGTPLDGPNEQSLLRNSVDLVIPNLTYLDAINKVNSKTPQFVYTNVSNIYLSLLTDWNEYADRNRLAREGAFYHVTKATPLTGASASSMPVNQFWGVYRGSDSAGWRDVTRDSRNPAVNFALADRGEAVAFGYLEKFREVNLSLRSSGAAGWGAELEYVSAVDASGRPTRWSRLTPQSDTTTGFRRNGRAVFDPPRDWQPASIGGSARLYYVRARTTGMGTAPVVSTLLGADYTAGRIIPAFDTTADRDRDGYLSDAEYAKRRPGMDARFVYQSRLTYPNYGPWRLATNVSDPGFRAWAADYHTRFLAATPLASGFFVDNSIGRLAVDPTGVAESLAGYSADYGSLLGAINKRLSVNGHWLIANTAGGNTTAEPIVRNGVSFLEEFALRPLSANHVQFDDLTATLAYRRRISGGRAYEILDTLPTQNVDANNPRMQLSSLAMYYAVADPELSFLMLNGGNEPASSWNRHFFKAVEHNVGKPRGAHTLFATGQDPTARALQYKVYQREYTNALVFYKPVSYTRGQTGGIGDATATTHQLNGLYRPLRADGTLGAPTRTVTLRNGDGAIMVRV